MSSTIESVLHETRVFPPSAEFVKQANVAGQAVYDAMCKEAERDFEGFWARLAREYVQWHKPFSKTLERWLATKDPKIIWEGHYAGIDIPYSHMEKLRHLEQLPPFGFVVSCLPVKIKGASGGWIRAVAMFD